jgi:hypothetical protein
MQMVVDVKICSRLVSRMVNIPILGRFHRYVRGIEVTILSNSAVKCKPNTTSLPFKWPLVYYATMHDDGGPPQRQIGLSTVPIHFFSCEFPPTNNIEKTFKTFAIMATAFDRERHIKYFAHHLIQLPFPYSSLDTNRLTLVHFAVHALDMLGVWDDDDQVSQLSLNKQSIIDWIYGLQVTGSAASAGFKGGTFLGGSLGDEDPDNLAPRDYNHGHIAMTYTALCTLAKLGDNYSRLDKENILKSLKTLQREEDGSFQCVSEGSGGSEHDMRFLFCACAISCMLNDWSGVDKERAADYVRNCRSFDGAIALIPGQVRCSLLPLYH